jgi:hypothetical protein
MIIDDRNYGAGPTTNEVLHSKCHDVGDRRSEITN